MKKQINFLASFLLIIIFLSSCHCDRKDLGVTFVFDKPLEESKNYPAYFQEVALPFSAECVENCIDFLPKPISISRLDISKKEIKINAWYFEAMGDNTIDFSMLWLGTYFKDSIPPAYLFEPQGGKVQLKSFLKKNKTNTYIYSEESGLEDYEGVKIFSSTKNLQEAIMAGACKNTSNKVYVLINPTMEEGKDENDDETLSSPNELTQVFNQIGEKGVSPDIRINLIDGRLGIFSEDAQVKEFGKNGTLVAMTPVRDYLEKIAFYRTLEKIEIREALQNANNRYWEVSLVEHHLNDPK